MDGRDGGSTNGSTGGTDALMAGAAREATVLAAHWRRSGGARVRPGQTEIYVHLTDLTLATGTRSAAVEGIGPMIADQLSETHRLTAVRREAGHYLNQGCDVNA